MAYWPLPTPARANKACSYMAVACGHADAESVLKPWDGTRLEIQALDVEGCALQRAMLPLLASAGAITAVLNIGWTAAVLSLFHERVMIYSRTLSEGGLAAIIASTRDQLGLDEELALHLLTEQSEEVQNDDDILTELRSVVTGQADIVLSELNVSFSYVAHQYPDVPLTAHFVVWRRRGHSLAG